MGLAKWDMCFVVERLGQGDDEVFKALYRDIKDDFVEWLQNHYQVEEATATDCFQEAMSNLYLNAYAGKIRASNATLKTYIFAIGKKQLLSRNYKYRRESDFSGLEDETSEDFLKHIYDPEHEKNQETEKVKDLLEKLDAKCQKLLQLTYLSTYTYEQVAEILGYNQHVLRTKKWRCLKKLRSYLNQK